jgi:phosphatidylinositol-binding clathrin assembly protein
MSRPDAERALNIYKTFGKQTEQVVQYLSLARQYEMSTRLEVPKLKHAPTTLTASLEEYLNDPDFEINRRQYLAQQEAKRTGKPMPTAAPAKSSSTTTERPVRSDNSFPSSAPRPAVAQAKGPAPDLIDFFESIEQNQQPMAQPTYPPQQQFQHGFVSNPQYSQYQVAAQPTGYNPFLQSPVAQQPQAPQQLQPDFTGAGFGGYTAQPQQPQQSHAFQFSSPLSSIPQNGVADFQSSAPVQSPIQQLQPQQTSTNPFRQSMMPTGASPPPAVGPPSGQGTNPFAKQPTGATQAGFGQSNPSPFEAQQPQTQHQELQSSSAFFASAPPQSDGQSQFSSPTSIQPQQTGTNPFAKNRSPPPAAPLVANVTGSTNPFRQSAFVNQQTGQGWQHSSQGTFSGFDVNNVPTMPVFPRPGAN